MMITRREAGLLELVNGRPCTSDGVAVDQWIQRILDATSDSQDNILKEDILSDDEDDTVLLYPPMRMQSMDRFDIFTESFEQLILNN